MVGQTRHPLTIYKPVWAFLHEYGGHHVRRTLLESPSDLLAEAVAHDPDRQDAAHEDHRHGEHHVVRGDAEQVLDLSFNLPHGITLQDTASGLVSAQFGRGMADAPSAEPSDEFCCRDSPTCLSPAKQARTKWLLRWFGLAKHAKQVPRSWLTTPGLTRTSLAQVP